MELTINVSRIEEFNERVRFMNKRIKKMTGVVDDIKTTFGEQRVIAIRVPDPEDPTGRHMKEYEVLTVKVAIESSFIGQDIKINGWSIRAVADYTGQQSEAEFKVVSPFSDGLRARLAPRKAQVCDHCGRRVFRNKIIIVADEAGNEKAVGNTCVSDFLGWGTPEQVLSMALLKFTSELDEEHFGVRHCPDDEVFDLVDYLIVAKRIIEGTGGQAIGKSHETLTPTGEFMYASFNPYPNPKHPPKFKVGEILDDIQEADLTVVQAAINWSKAQDAQGNEFHKELGVYIRDGYVGRPHRSIAFWIVGSYINSKREKKEKRPVLNEYYGEVKKTVELTLELVFKTHFFGEWGVTYLYKFMDPEGRTFVTKTSNCLGAPNGDRTAWRDAEAGDVYEARVRIMGHEEYNGIKETRVGYAKFNLVKMNVTAEEAAVEQQKGV